MDPPFFTQNQIQMSDKMQIRKVGRPFMPEKDKHDWKMNVRLTCDDRDMLDEVAEAYEMKKSDVVRELIRHHHEYMKKFNMLKKGRK